MNIEYFNSKLIITSSDNLFVFDPSCGSSQQIKIPPPEVPPNLTKGQLEVLNKEDRTINSIAISQNNMSLAVATENKQIVVYDYSFNVTKNFIVNRAASKLLYTKSGDILVADRTGDVYLYKCGQSEPVLLLGHLSMILDMALSDCENYIVTCDRDEKIRVSHYPNTYNIVSFCLGHEEFVTKIQLVKKILLSAAGDGTVRIWNYLKGEQLNLINTNQYVDNVNLLQEFSDKMDKEKVDVTSLPITDMQVQCINDHLLLAVSVHSYNGIQLYKIESETFKWNILKLIQPVQVLHKSYLNNDTLFIFDKLNVVTYQLINDDFSIINSENLNEFYKRYKELLNISDDTSITVLYKRKFDNVQEYLERKKLRLESRK